jgi:predicted aspartyl protease
LRAGKVESALVRALLAYKAEPGRPSIETLLGDIYYRMADFDKAEAMYRSAETSDPCEARAWLGLGRLDLLNSCRRAARAKFTRAYALDPRDPQVVRAYASNADSVAEEVAILKKYLAMRVEQQRDLESALGHIIFHEKTGNRKLGVLASKYCRYELPLQASKEGTFLLQVRINEGRPQRLILDTGARGIVISARAARDLGLRYLVQSALGGLGNSDATSAQTALADTVRIGDLTYRDCAIDVSDRSLSERADGVIGSVVFQQFLVSLDIPGKRVELLPFEEELPDASQAQEDWADRDRAIPAGMEHFIPIAQISNILLVPTQLKGAGSGYFMLDTGASASSVSRSLAPNVNLTFFGASFMFHGANGDLQTTYRAYPFELRFANHSFIDPALIALDLRSISNQEGVEISGFIGCPMLSHSRITIDYRDGLLNVEDDR